MLVRAARRKACHEILHLRLAPGQSNLPWLYPIINAHRKDRRQHISVDTDARRSELAKRRNSKDASSLPARRSLATAVGHDSLDDIPFEGIGNMPLPSADASSWESNAFKQLDSAGDPIYLRDSLSVESPRYFMRKAGLSGELPDLKAIVDACLSVGRLERASLIIRRMSMKEFFHQDDAIELHNKYLRVALEQVLEERNEKKNNELHKWFKCEIVGKGLIPNAETVAYMVKASLIVPGKGREQLVQRYMNMLEEETGYQVLALNVLTAEEVNHVTHICPAYNLAADPDFSPEHDTDTMEEHLPQNSPVDIQKTDARSVRPTEQKGLGLKSLHRSLASFTSLDSQDLANLSETDRQDIQIKIELDSVTAAIDRWREESTQLSRMGLNTTLQTKSMGARMWRWQLDLVDYLENELKKVDAAESSEHRDITELERCAYGPFLRLVPTEKLAAISILTIMTSMSVGGVDKGLALSTAIMALANSVEDEAVCAMVQQKSKSVWPNMKDNEQKRFAFPGLLKKLGRRRQPGSAAKFVNTSTTNFITASPNTAWSVSIKGKVGAILLSALIETAKVPVSLHDANGNRTMTQIQPAFTHAHRYKMGKKVGVVHANQHLISQLKREPIHSLLAKHLPMLVIPRPWSNFDQGGFLSQPSKVMRIKGSADQTNYTKAAIEQGDFTQAFKGLDILGKTPWQINQPVFDVILDAWNSGEAVGGIAPENASYRSPEEPDKSKGPLERRRWIKEIKVIENQRTANHTVRCLQNLQLEISRALRNQTFYFPHNIDFRGRAYPIPPYLNHIGADLCRGLLKFGVGKPLGKSGLEWLKIHLSNVYGFDKASLSERKEFTHSHIKDIYDSASNPLSGNKWWLKAEDPWQCLAACMELRNALESPDPSSFVSQLPVHQDGTCNGLQHYAALGGDLWGAKQVNLEPGDRPSDVYTAVAELVKESIAVDKANGDPRAAYLDGKITRKTVKQTVMTNVYGVTFTGAIAQVRKQLISAGHVDGHANATVYAAYISRKIFDSLASMFSGAQDIQYWLGECANRITMSLTYEQLNRLEMRQNATSDKTSRNPRAHSKDPSADDPIQFKSTVIWTTPLRLPVVQPYRNSRTRHIDTLLQQISLSEPHTTEPVVKRKQLQGFPPNFIHSLDATHMLLSALRCDELNLTFASVHDSFWTHACDIPTMNIILREAFIRIHSENVIGRLRAEFEARYKNGLYYAYILDDSPLYHEVESWRRTWKISRRREMKKLGEKEGSLQNEELLLEHKRRKLLNSTDAEDIAQGKALVTPASIFEKMAAVKDLARVEELKSRGLGEVSAPNSRSKTPRNLMVNNSSNLKQSNPITGEDSIIAGVGEDAEVTEDMEDMEDMDNMEDVDDNQQILLNEEDFNAEEQPAVPRFEKLALRGRIHKKRQNKMHIWLPLKFPPVPKKGDFDVQKLRDSKYFFS